MAGGRRPDRAATRAAAVAGQPVPRRRRRRRAPAANPFAPPADRRPANPFLDEDAPAAPTRSRRRRRPARRSADRRAPQVAAPRPRPRRRRQLRQGPLRGRGRGGLLPVRPADGVPAGAADARALPGPAGRAAPGGHHLHRDDRGRARRAAWACGWSPPCATTSRPAGSPRSRPTPRPAPGPDATSAATPAFWLDAGFALAVADDAVPGHAPRAGLIRMLRLLRSAMPLVRGSSRSPCWPRS